MKIFSTKQVREADAYTIENEPIAPIDLMERAANQLFKWIKKRIDKTHTINIFAGLGNNGGDGLVLARLLFKKGYHVNTYIIRYADKTSADFQTNYHRLVEAVDSTIVELKTKNNLPTIQEDDIIVDAIFGSGLARPVSGFLADIIHYINGLDALKIAVDIPSGLFADSYSRSERRSYYSC